MRDKWMWVPVLFGAIILGWLALLCAAYWVLVLEESHSPVICLPSLTIGALIGAGLGALLSVIPTGLASVGW